MTCSTIRYAKGKRLFEERKWVGAVAAFELAYKLRPHFFVQCSIARCYQNLNDMIEAAERYRRCLKEGGAGKKDVAKRVGGSLRAVEAQITWVMVRSAGRGGTIYVGGKPAGEAPRKIPLNPGSHVIEVRREGAKSATATIKTLGGEERDMSLVPLDLKLPETEGERKDTPEKPSPKRRGLHQAWFWTTAGITAALAVAATVLGVQTLSLQSEYNDDPTQERADRFFQRRMLTNVFWGLTAAAAGTGTVLFFYTDFGGRGKEAENNQREVALGVGIRGRF
jgi:hypothetical protein